MLTSLFKNPEGGTCLSAWFTAAITGTRAMTGNQCISASVYLLRSSCFADSQDIGEAWEATAAQPMPSSQGDEMPTIYVLLLMTLLVFVLYVTWRPSTKKSAHPAPKQRPNLNTARDVAGTSKIADLPTLNFPTSTARGNTGGAQRH
jgi:hypothetical protein